VRREHGFLRSRIFALAALAGLAGCSGMTVLEDSPTSVSIRYDGVSATEADVTATANRLCAAHGKVAQLRSSDTKGVIEHYANFNCVRG
jgi:hypothetical protein